MTCPHCEACYNYLMRNNEIAEKVTAQILASLEKGEIPWTRPWSLSGALNPVNVSTGKGYRGVNTVILYLAQQTIGCKTSRWLTFNQAKAKGGTVRKGEKGTQIVFWKFLEGKEVNAKGEKNRIPLCRFYTVFNISQCEGLPEAWTALPETLPVIDRNEAIDAFISGTGASISHGGDRACYSPSEDKVSLPEPGQFENMGAYYATAFHELVHWTGHETRCKRQLGQRFGKELYAVEELVAELGSAFLCAEFGVEGKLQLQHTAYIQNWISVLKNDKNAIFAASRMAQEATDRLMEKAGLRKPFVSEETVSEE